jgi:DNA-binding CsgD family transcriptional regulator
MARTLFFIEAFLFAALAIAFPIISSETAAAFILPVAISLVLPFSCAVAIWPPRSVARAMGSAFSSRGPDPEAVESARILEELGSFSRAAAGLGLLFSLSAACQCIPFTNGMETWTFLGIYLSAYALLNAMLWRILAAVVARQVAPSALGATRSEAGSEHGSPEAFAAAYGLTPREWETAERIALGLSYKETAYELGISIKTVKAHMSSVYEKTGAASNVALALLMRGLGRPSTKVQ